MISKKQETLKRSMLVVLLLLIPSMLYAACTGTSPSLYAASASQSDVMACINEATYGDTINVPAGSATWTATSQGCLGNSMLCMKKGINLKGAGSASTVITLSGSAPYGAIAYEPDSASIANNTPFEFAGFAIDGENQYYGEGMLDVRNGGLTAITQIKINNNTFKNNTSQVIVINGPVYGVAYSNTFIDCESVIKVEGHNDRSWNLGHREYGTVNSFYFEDNTANCTTAKSCGAFTAGQGGGIVYRYNTMDMGHVLLDGNQWSDLHGLQSMTDIGGGTQCGYEPYNVPNSCLPEVKSCTEWSQVKSEWYGNNAVNFYNPYSTPQEWMRHRGSWLLMFYNNIEGTGHMPLPDIYQYSCDSCASSGSYSQHVQNTYVWSNIGQGEGNRPISVLQDNCGSYAQGTPYKMRENVDFWNYNASFNGTFGIGCGPLANLPATCSTGVAYWATNQSCTDMTGMVGANPLNPISGTLYKCTSTNKWEPYYTPYTYPHPLRVQKFTGNACSGCGGYYR